MAEIVLGLGTSHGPQLMVPPDMWQLREAADRANTRLHFRGQVFDFETLAHQRSYERDFARESEMDHKQKRFAQCQESLRVLRDMFVRSAADIAVVIGNDQFELFSETNIPAFSIFWGDSFQNIPKTPEQMAKLPPGVAPAEQSYAPAKTATYAGEPALARHIIEHMIGADFDVAQSKQLPIGPFGNNSIPHAYGYVYRQIMMDDVVPSVPVMINTHYPPNRPSARRCFDFGTTLARAISSWPSQQRVAVIASGGMTHYVVDEAFDQKIFAAVQEKDWQTIKTLPEDMFEAGTAEHKNWIPLYGIVAEAGLNLGYMNYVPCYRSIAGTGNGMGFAYWN